MQENGLQSEYKGELFQRVTGFLQHRFIERAGWLKNDQLAAGVSRVMIAAQF